MYIVQSHTYLGEDKRAMISVLELFEELRHDLELPAIVLDQPGVRRLDLELGQHEIARIFC